MLQQIGNSDEEFDEDDTDSEKGTKVKPPTIKKKRYDTKFQKFWLTDDHFKDWGTQQVLFSGPKLVGVGGWV